MASTADNVAGRQAAHDKGATRRFVAALPPSRVLVRALLVVWLLGGVALGAFVGVDMAVLVLAAGALASVVGLLWSSLQSLTGEAELTLEEALGLAAPTAEEEQKRAVLRTLKDLEYERSVGKISEQDYLELSARYRAEAKRLLRALDQDLIPLRERAEARAKRRLRRIVAASAEPAAEAPGSGDEQGQESEQGASKKSPESDDPQPPSETAGRSSAQTTSEAAASKPASACDKCGTANDADALFCKKCGSSLGQEAPP